MENKKDYKSKRIKSSLSKARWFLLAGILVILIMPFLFTGHSFNERFDFTGTGQIGDTIGGITAPFLNLIGAFLVFYALQAQVTANELIQSQIDKDNETKELDNEAQNLNQIYSYLIDSINSFRFRTLPKEFLKKVNEDDFKNEYSGGEAFYQLFSQINCHYHGTPSQLRSHQPVSELISILKIMDLLLDELQTTKSKNKEILLTLINHLFNYKIITRVREDSVDELQVEYCDVCECNHGLPDELRNLIGEIRAKLQNDILED